jgi:hypothetical protein
MIARWASPPTAIREDPCGQRGHALVGEVFWNGI